MEAGQSMGTQKACWGGGGAGGDDRKIRARQLGKVRLKHLSSCWQEGGSVQESALVKAAFQSDSSKEGKPGGLGAGRGRVVVWRGMLGRAGRKD